MENLSWRNNLLHSHVPTQPVRVRPDFYRTVSTAGYELFGGGANHCEFLLDRFGSFWSVFDGSMPLMQQVAILSMTT